MVSAQLVGIMAAIAAAQARIAAMQAHNDWCLQVGDSGLYPEEAFSAEADGKAPPKVLSAEEVTEPGWYKMRYPSGYSEFVRAISGGGCSCRIITIEGQFHNLSDCRFIGPVSPSES